MSEENLKKTIVAVGSIVIIIIIALIMSFGINKSSMTKLEKEAEAFIKDGDYESASGVYAKLISKTGEKEYKDKKKSTDLMIKDSRQFDIGVEKMENEDYINGIRYFKNMDKEDEFFLKKAKEELEKAEKGILEIVEEAIKDDNTYLASSILNDYISIVGKSEKAEEILKSLEGTAVENEGEEETEETNPTGDITAELPEDSKEWVGKTFEIKTGKANIREEAKLDSKVVTTIAKGGTITIEKIENDGERTWCFGTVTSGKTGETFKAWVSSKNL